jgi:hypothetical protein
VQALKYSRRLLLNHRTTNEHEAMVELSELRADGESSWQEHYNAGVAFPSLLLSLTISDFDEYLTNSHIFNASCFSGLRLLKNDEFTFYSYSDKRQTSI